MAATIAGFFFLFFMMLTMVRAFVTAWFVMLMALVFFFLIFFVVMPTATWWSFFFIGRRFWVRFHSLFLETNKKLWHTVLHLLSSQLNHFWEKWDWEDRSLNQSEDSNCQILCQILFLSESSLSSPKLYQMAEPCSNLAQILLKPRSNLAQTLLKPRSNLTQTSLKPR